MPTYDFKCRSCETVNTRYGVAYEDRHNLQHCDACGGACDYVFPTDAATRVRVVDAYFDEGLGVDVHGEKERKQIMAARGLIEAGDAVGGARNFDAAAPNHVGRQPAKGFRFADWQRKNDNPAVREGANSDLAAVHEDGTVTPFRLEDCPKRLF